MSQTNQELKPEDFYNIIFKNEPYALTAGVMKRVEKSFDFLQKFSKDKVIYGVNTGLGPMAQFKINDEDVVRLQYNLIRSHSSGTGTPLPAAYVKAAVLARLNTLCLGKSGVHPSVVRLLHTLLEREIVPLIFSHGGVGASGDLVQLAHLALVMIGEGEVFYKGKRRNTKEVFAEEKIEPITVTKREGLALMNGTSVMNGIGMINCLYAERLLNHITACSAALNEIVESYDDHMSAPLNEAKKHSGQQRIAARMRERLTDSQLIQKREEHLYKKEADDPIFIKKVQEIYSLRCVPQILGPVLDTLDNVKKVLTDEVNSANDNPIVDAEREHIYHGGNFHGDYVALEMDKLKLVTVKMTMLAERQLNFLLNAKVNEIWPPFVNLGTLGLNLGMQGVQFTAVSTTAESQTLANPVYVHSIPNNNDNQDIVSMGTNAALMTKTVIENGYEVVAVELMALAQAIEISGQQDRLSAKTKQLYEAVRNIMPPFKEDLIMYPYVQKVKDFLTENDL